MAQYKNNSFLRYATLALLLVASIIGGYIYKQATAEASQNNTQLQGSLDDLELYTAAH